MSVILLPLGAFLIAICVTYITMVTVFEIEYSRRDDKAVAIGGLGCALMMIGLFTLHIP